MKAVARGGPRRVAALAEAAEAKAEAVRRVEEAGAAGERTAEEEERAKQRIEQVARRLAARLRETVAALSERRGLVEWRAASIYVAWRWRAAVSQGRGLRTEVLVEPTETWMLLMRAGEVVRDEERRYQPITSGNANLVGRELRSWAEAERGRRLGEGKAPGADRRAVTARAWWRRGGGRSRAERLRGEEIQEGRMTDSRGRHALEGGLDVRRPEGRRGRQLEALLRWRGINPASGMRWKDEWKPVSAHYLTEDMRAKARRMEGVKYGKRPAERRVEGERRSMRLAESRGDTGAARGGAGGSTGGGAEQGASGSASGGAGGGAGGETGDGGDGGEVDDAVGGGDGGAGGGAGSQAGSGAGGGASGGADDGAGRGAGGDGDCVEGGCADGHVGGGTGGGPSGDASVDVARGGAGVVTDGDASGEARLRRRR